MRVPKIDFNLHLCDTSLDGDNQLRVYLQYSGVRRKVLLFSLTVSIEKLKQIQEITIIPSTNTAIKWYTVLTVGLLFSFLNSSDVFIRLTNSAFWVSPYHTIRLIKPTCALAQSNPIYCASYISSSNQRSLNSNFFITAVLSPLIYSAPG